MGPLSHRRKDSAVTTTPDALTRQWFQQVWNEGRADVIEHMLAPDAVVHGLGGSEDAPMRGAAGFMPVFHAFRDAFPDLHITVERTVVQEDVCVAWCRVRARHTGNALGPASGREVDFEGVTVARARDGQLVEGWNVFDFLRMYQQIGWIPDPVAPVART